MRSRISELIGGESGRVYEEVLAGVDAGIYHSVPHEFIDRAHHIYKNSHPDRKNVHGRVFEYLICETLAQQNIVPFYCQATFERVPNVKFDIVLYDPREPVVLSIKTSLRERYKQADLEGQALQAVYRKAKSYLITLSDEEAPSVNQKIAEGAVMGLQKCVVASSAQYDELLKILKNKSFGMAEKVRPLDGQLFQTSAGD